MGYDVDYWLQVKDLKDNLHIGLKTTQVLQSIINHWHFHVQQLWLALFWDE